MANPETDKLMNDTLTAKTSGNYGGSRMWEVIHETDDIKLPAIHKPPLVPLCDGDESTKYKNPFRLSPGIDVMKFLENEFKLNKKNKERERAMRVEDKTTYSRQTKQLPKVERKEAKLPSLHKPKARNIDENGLKSKRQPISEHIQNMRQRRLILYSAHIMKEEMEKLDGLVKAEETKLTLAEEDMKTSLNKLDKARMEMDQKHIEVRQMSRQLVMECHKQRVKINKITSRKLSLELDISDAKEKLTDYKMYHEILKLLSMQSEEGSEKSDEVEEPNVKFDVDKPAAAKLTGFVMEASRRASRKSFLTPRKSLKNVKLKRFSQKIMKSRDSTHSEDLDSDQPDIDTDKELAPLTKVEVYFESPEKVMELCTELYYQNITRILKFRQIEDELKETQMALVEAGKKNEVKLVKLTDHIKERSEALNKQKNKLRDIQIKVMIHSAGSNLTADKESNWEMLKKKVSEVYISLLGRSKVRISTQQKLTNIENRIFELLQQLESAPSEKVEAVWEAKSKEKKQRIKELCYLDLKERRKKLIKKSWKNVLATAKRGPARKLMYRSMISAKRKDETKVPERILSYEDDMAYYFTG